MKKIIIILFISFALGACHPQPPISKEIKPPLTIQIQNKDKRSIGKGLHLDGETFATADHLFVDHKDLFWETEPLEIWLRDFDHDLLFFKLLGATQNNHNLSINPPSLGQKLYWEENEIIYSSEVQAIKASFGIDQDNTKKNLIVLQGNIEPGSSGSPIFNGEGLVYGLIIAADRTKNEIYGLRSDIILEVFEENKD